MHKQAPDITVSAFRYSAAGALSRDKAQPCGKLAARSELPRITNGRDDGASRDRANSRDAFKPAAYSIGTVPSEELYLDRTNPMSYVSKLRGEHGQHLDSNH